MRISYTPNKAKPFQARLDDDHLTMLQRLMQTHQMNGTQVIRMLIRDAARKARRKQKASAR